MATSTAADRQEVTELSSSNATLTNELRAATSTIATLQQHLAIFSCATTPQTLTRGQHCLQASQQRQHNLVRNMTPLDPNGYCRSHGYRIRMGHNGSSYYKTLPRHQCAAIGADPIGGIINNKPEWCSREGLKQMDTNYSNLVNKKIHKMLNFNSICLYSSLEAVADSSTTRHYITTKTLCVDKRIANNPIPINMPNGEIIT